MPAVNSIKDYVGLNRFQQIPDLVIPHRQPAPYDKLRVGWIVQQQSRYYVIEHFYVETSPAVSGKPNYAVCVKLLCNAKFKPYKSTKRFIFHARWLWVPLIDEHAKIIQDHIDFANELKGKNV